MHILLKDNPGEKRLMLGALARTGRVPLDVELFRQVIRKNIKPALVDTNLKAFDLGFEAAAKVA